MKTISTFLMLMIMSIAPIHTIAELNMRKYIKTIEIPVNEDTIKTSKKYNVLINNETGYGILPFNYTKPYSGFFNRSYLQVDIDALIPLRISFDYNTPYFGGLNYTYNISLDRQRLKERLNNNSVKDIQKLKQQISTLQDIKSNQTKKLIYLHKKELVYMSKIEKGKEKGKIAIDPHEIQNPLINLEQKNDSLLNENLPASISGGKFNTSTTDTTNNVSSHLNRPIPDHKVFSLNDSLHLIRNEKMLLESSLDSITDVLKGVEKQLAYYEKGITDLYFAKLPKKRLSLQSIKNLNAGLFSPDHQSLMINNVQINGGNIELENKYYFSFMHGKVVDPFLLSSSSHSALALPNYGILDMFNSKHGKTISVVKGGIGGLETSHLHIGILWGKNNLTLYDDDIGGVVFDEEIKNTVLEIDAKYNYKNHEFSFQAAKSLIQNDETEELSVPGKIESLFNSKYSSAMGMKYRSAFSKTQTSLILTSVYTQPFFKSYGSYLHGQDVIKNELQINQVISSKLKVKTRYKNERSNIMKLYDYKTELENISFGMNYRLNRRITIIWSSNPLRFRISNTEGFINNLAQLANTFVINFIPKSKSVFHNITGSLSHFYNRANELEEKQTYDISLKDMMRFNNELVMGLQVRYGQAVDINNAINHLYNFSVEAEKKLTNRLTISASMSTVTFNHIAESEFGYLLRSSYSVFKNMDISICGEKYLFMGYMNEEINNFPGKSYSISMKTNVSF